MVMMMWIMRMRIADLDNKRADRYVEGDVGSIVMFNGEQGNGSGNCTSSHEIITSIRLKMEILMMATGGVGASGGSS
eukprot:6805565-Karenia_brevis.AAC.1